MPITTLTITDLTRMRGGHVCIAGVTDAGLNIRPVFEHEGIDEEWLFINNRAIIRPFARIQFDLLEHRPINPHSEDWIVRQNFRRFERTLSDTERYRLLDRVNDQYLDEIFGAEIQDDFGLYIPKGSGNRSLGTIRVVDLFRFEYAYNYEKWEYKITFSDQSGACFRLAVTDLAFKYYVDFQRENMQITPEKISADLTKQLKATEIFLRIGLTRPNWDKHPDCCHLQINGIYTFPDYLNGRCFADFRPN